MVGAWTTSFRRDPVVVGDRIATVATGAADAALLILLALVILGSGVPERSGHTLFFSRNS